MVFFISGMHIQVEMESTLDHSKNQLWPTVIDEKLAFLSPFNHQYWLARNFLVIFNILFLIFNGPVCH